jgi:acetyl esterase/lipase
LPRPGALGLYCSGASAKFKEGDSTIFTNLLRSTVHVGENPSNYDYFNGFDPDDPRLSPVNDLAVLAQFPATLIVTSTRDFAMSMAACTHRRLQESGVESEFLLYDGLGHAFMNDPDLPESASVYRLSAAFFDQHLGQ